MSAMETITVRVRADHLDRMTYARKPIVALQELIWNSLDADADNVRVGLEWGEMHGMQRITVEDNGEGLDFAAAKGAFGNLGGSIKRGRDRSTRGRRLHGRAGKGRFRALALGNHVTWNSVYRGEDGILKEFSIIGNRASLGEFRLDAPRPSVKSDTGMTVVIEDLQKNFHSLEPEKAISELRSEFALYLQQYPEIVINYEGQRVDPKALQLNAMHYPIRIEVEGIEYRAELTVIEWAKAMDRCLVLCDEDGISLETVKPGIHAPGFNFSGYIKAKVIREANDQGRLEEMDPVIAPLIEEAKEQLRTHFKERDAEQSALVVKRWKDARVYPYDGKAETSIEVSERKVFDVVALSIDKYLPKFNEMNQESQRLLFSLLRRVVEHEPTSVTSILKEVLKLPVDKLNDFDRLLQKTSLSAIISSAKQIADRLEFLKGFEELILTSRSRQRNASISRRSLSRTAGSLGSSSP